MTVRRLRSIKGRRVRVIRRNPDGSIAPGPVQIVSDGFVRVEVSGVYQGGRQFYYEDLYGTPAIIDADDDVLKWLTVTIDMVDVDPNIATLLVGNQPVHTLEGDRLGSTFRQGRNSSAVSVEVWTRNVPTECGDPYEWGYAQVPFLRGLRLSAPLIVDQRVMTLSASGLGMPTSTWVEDPTSASPIDDLVDVSGQRLAVFMVTADAPPEVDVDVMVPAI